MAWIHVAVTAAVAFFALDPAQAQIGPLQPVQPSIIDEMYRPQPQRWGEVGSPPPENMVNRIVAEGEAFDLAIDPGGLPVLAFIDDFFKLQVRKWDGHEWASLKFEVPVGFIPWAVRAASSSGNVVIAVRATHLDGFRDATDIFRLDGSKLVRMPDPSDFSRYRSYVLAMDGQNPVFAAREGGSLDVRRWNGSRWDELGGEFVFAGLDRTDPRNPGLAVTEDGRIVVAYSRRVGNRTVISASSWDGTRWSSFGEDIAFPAVSPSLGAGHGLEAVAAYLNGRNPEVRRRNGSNWSVPERPCTPPRGRRNFGLPSLAIRRMLRGTAAFSLADQPMLACAFGRFNGQERTLVARIRMPSGSWEELGINSINGPVPLAEGRHFAFVMRADWRGRPWVAWSALGEDGWNVRVSTLFPLNDAKP
jgi:hypothetical protein